MLYQHPDYNDTCLFHELTQYVSLDVLVVYHLLMQELVDEKITVNRQSESQRLLMRKTRDLETKLAGNCM